MKNVNWFVILLIGVVLFLFFKNGNADNSQLSKDEYLNVKADLVHQISDIQITPVRNPNPEPDNKIPELANCPLCKGSRVITHADGHKTPCPYHGNTNEELQALEDSLHALSLELVEQDKMYDALVAEMKLTKGKLDVIDQHHKPTTTTKLIANNCPCGCRHTVGNCTCAANCPGKRLEVYRKITVINPPTQNTKTTATIISPVSSQKTPVRTAIKTVAPPYPALQQNRQARQAQNYGYYQRYEMSCSGGSCSFRPRRIRGWR